MKEEISSNTGMDDIIKEINDLVVSNKTIGSLK